MNADKITGWSRQQAEISARREPLADKIACAILALIVCALFVGWLDYAVA